MSKRFMLDLSFIYVFVFVRLCLSRSVINAPTDFVDRTHLTVTKGDNVTLSCQMLRDPSIEDVIWNTPDQGMRNGYNLTITDIETSGSGVYYCFAQNQTATYMVESYELDVLSPAILRSVNTTSTTLSEGDTFYMTFIVEGNPSPQTTFQQGTNGRILSKYTNTGIHNAAIVNARCSDAGVYWLLSNNAIGNDSVFQNITIMGIPQPNPDYPTARTQYPRIRDTVTMMVHSLGCPFPTFTWTFRNANLSQEGDESISVLTLTVGSHEDFGDYNLTMVNIYGKRTLDFKLVARGPPDPVSMVNLLEITETSAVMEFIPGYDYDNAQWFTLDVASPEIGTELNKRINDTTDGQGNTTQSYTLKGLSPGTMYNLRIMAENSEGAANPSNMVYFRSGGSSVSDKGSAIIVGVSVGLVVVVAVAGIVCRRRHKSGNPEISSSESTPINSGQVPGHKGHRNNLSEERTGLLDNTVTSDNNSYRSFSTESNSDSLFRQYEDHVAMIRILQDTRLGHLCEAFEMNLVGPREVPFLSDADMRRLGVVTIGDKIRLQQACKAYIE